MVLYQSVGSNTCAICATANLLHLYGTPCSRETAYAFFGLPLGASGFSISHATLLWVANRYFRQRDLWWRRLPHFSVERLSRLLKDSSVCSTPTLVTIHIRHREREWSGIHCVIATGADEGGIHVFDSLGRRDGSYPNATITPKESRLGWRVAGSPIIVTRRPTRILCGLPQFAGREGKI